MAIRRSTRKPRNESEPIQKDLLAQVHPVCPKCQGEGRKLVLQRYGRTTNSDWAYMKFAAQALGTWQVLVEKEPHFAQYIEKKVRRARYIEGDRYYAKCAMCGGCGHITPEIREQIKRWLIWRRDHGFKPLRDYYVLFQTPKTDGEKTSEKS